MPAEPAPAVALTFVQDDEPAIEVPIEVDWMPAVEWVRFRAVRRGADPAAVLESAWRVEPRWDAERGAPRLSGFRVVAQVEEPDREAEETVLPLAFLAELARDAAAALMKEGKLPSDQQVGWYAFTPPAEPEASRTESGAARFKTRAVAPRLALEPRVIGDAIGRADAVGEQHPADLPVFLPGSVLREVAGLTLQCAGRETGGVLIGHLRRDRGAEEVFVEVTGQIPARDAVGDSGHLEFTAQVWADVRAALDLRRRSEIMVGWWHSHPVREWCKNCAEEKRADCALAAGFLSSADRRLHRTVFPRAYSVALVASDTGQGDPGMALFGWRMGQIERRGFYLMREDERHVA